jgi:hypothetical protein
MTYRTLLLLLAALLLVSCGEWSPFQTPSVLPFREYWKPGTTNLNLEKRMNYQVLAFGEQVLVLGGYTFTVGMFGMGVNIWNRGFRSADGTNWSAFEMTGFDASFAPSEPQETVVVPFKSKLLAIQNSTSRGPSYGTNYRSVLQSADGATWTLLTTNKGFDAPAGTWFPGAFVEWKNALWHFSTSTNQGQVTTDGANWVSFATTDITARDYPTLFVLDNKLWITGGRSMGYLSSTLSPNSTWSSTDGTNWTKAGDNPYGFSDSGANGFFLKNQVWIISESFNDAGSGQIIRSDNGIQWSLFGTNVLDFRPAYKTGVSYTGSGQKFIKFRERLWMLFAARIPTDGSAEQPAGFYWLDTSLP